MDGLVHVWMGGKMYVWMDVYSMYVCMNVCVIVSTNVWTYIYMDACLYGHMPLCRKV